MSKSLIYTALTNATLAAVGSTIPLGSTIRRKGCCISMNGSAINVAEPGYYDVDVSATFTAPVAGNVTVALLQEGVAVPGGTATTTITTPTTQVENIGITATIRVPCGAAPDALTLVVSGVAATFSNVAVRVTKVA